MAVSEEHSTAQVRLASTDDVAELVPLNEGLFVEDAGTRDPFTVKGFDSRDYFSELIADGSRNVVWAADVGGAVVGYVVGRFKDSGDLRSVSTAVLESMFVHPDHRNARVGTALVEAFLRWAQELGAGSAVVTAYAENAGAIRIYERFGWRPKHVTFDMAVSGRGGSTDGIIQV